MSRTNVRAAPFLALLALLPSCSGLGNPEPPGEEGFTLTPRRSAIEIPAGGLSVFSPRGNIRVVSSEHPFVELTLTISATDRTEAESIGERCTLTEQASEGGSLHIYLSPPRDILGERIGADYLIGAPQGLTINLHSISGLVDTSAYLAHKLTITTREGDIRLGKVEQLEFTTDTGHIELLEPFEKATGRSRQSDLRIAALQPAAALDYVSVSGNVELTTDEDVALEVFYRTIKGRIRAEFPLSKTKLPDQLPYNSFQLEIRSDASGKPAVANIQLDEGLLVLWVDSTG